VEGALSTGLVVVLFVACLALMLGATELLVRGIDQLGARVGLSEGLLGLLTALGADAPEVSSAIVALRGGHHAVGLGVVLGSNLFNLAALLGLGAVLAGRVWVHRASLALDGGIGLLVTLVIAALILHLVTRRSASPRCCSCWGPMSSRWRCHRGAWPACPSPAATVAAWPPVWGRSIGRPRRTRA